MSGIVNSTGAKSGVIGTTVGTPAPSSGDIVKFESIETTITSEQALDSVFRDINGSEITYTPQTNASYVIYEFSFKADAVDLTGRASFYLLKDGSVVSGNNHFTLLSSSASADSHGDLTYYRSRIAVWSGSGIIKMQARETGTSGVTDCSLHYNGHAEGTITNYYNPTVSIYSVM